MITSVERESFISNLLTVPPANIKNLTQQQRQIILKILRENSDIDNLDNKELPSLLGRLREPSKAQVKGLFSVIQSLWKGLLNFLGLRISSHQIRETMHTNPSIKLRISLDKWAAEIPPNSRWPSGAPFLTEDRIDAKERLLSCFLEKRTFLNLRDLELGSIPPDILAYMPHLEMIDLTGTRLRTPPNVSHNKALKTLLLNNNQLSEAPNVKNNIYLETLFLNNNQLTIPPDITQNQALKLLRLNNNELHEAPSLTKNPNLLILDLSNNRITSPPDVTQNLELIKLNLSHNQLIIAPDVTRNRRLEHLYLNTNNLKNPPDIRHNLDLESISLFENPLQKRVDLSQHRWIKQSL